MLDLKNKVPDLGSKVPDLKLEVPDLRSGGIRLNLTPAYYYRQRVYVFHGLFLGWLVYLSVSSITQNLAYGKIFNKVFFRNS